MMLPNLLNQPLVIFSQSASTDIDAYGNEVPTTTMTAVNGLLQQQGRSEVEGFVPSETSVCFLPQDTKIASDDSVVQDGHVYRVTGPPHRVWNPTKRVYSHIEATVTRTAGPEEGS